MQASWAVAATLLARAAAMLDRVELTPAALRADLAGARVAPQRLHAAAEVLSHAADLCCESAQSVHDDERRWRVTRGRIDQVVQALRAGAAPESPADDEGSTDRA